MTLSPRDTEILEAQIGSLYQQLPMVLTINVVNAALVAVVLAYYLGDERWWLFFALIAVLSAARAAVWEANDPGAGLQILERERPIDLLLTDYAMPEMTGAVMIERARGLQPGLKVVLMTGHAETLQAGGVAGVPLLRKPFKVAQLYGCTSRVLLSATEMNGQGATSAEIDRPPLDAPPALSAGGRGALLHGLVALTRDRRDRGRRGVAG